MLTSLLWIVLIGFFVGLADCLGAACAFNWHDFSGDYS